MTFWEWHVLRHFLRGKALGPVGYYDCTRAFRALFTSGYLQRWGDKYVVTSKGREAFEKLPD